MDSSEAINLFQFATNWTGKLVKEVLQIRKERKVEVDEIADVFGDPLELAKYYIEPDCQQFNPADDEEEEAQYLVREPVFRAMEGFLGGIKSSGMHQLFVLSDAGMGKTSLLLMLKLAHMNSFWPANLNCILHKIGPGSVDFVSGLKGRKDTVLLLDALDEDPLAWGRVIDRISEILNVSENFRRVVVTCRTQFFSAGEDPFNRRGQVEVAGHLCPVVYLSLFSNGQIERYLARRFGRSKKKIFQAKKVISHMRSLRCRPMLLAHIEDLIQSEDTQWTEYSIYNALVSAWLLREHRKARSRAENVDEVLPSPPEARDLRVACELLAKYLHKKNQRTISATDLSKMLSNDSVISHMEMMDVGGRSLLNKNSTGEFRFSHFSVQEFLIVSGSVAGSTADIGVLRLTDQILRFVKAWLGETQPSNRGGARLGKIDLEGANLRNFDLRCVDLCNAHMARAVLDGVSASNICLGRGDLREATFRGADFEGAIMEEIVMDGAAGQNSRFVHAELNYGHFSRVNFQGSNMDQCSLRHAILTDADLSQVILTGADLTGANLMNADFEGADLSCARMMGAHASGACLSGAILAGVLAREAHFQGANLTGVDFSDARLGGSSFFRAQLFGAKLQGANFSGADFKEAELTGAIYDNKTIFPRGFDPLEAGAMRVSSS